MRTSKASSTKKRKSKVWEHFDDIINEEKKEEKKVMCKLCKKEFEGSSKNGTTHLMNHFTRCQHRKDVETHKNTMNTCEIADIGGDFVYDDERSLLDMARMIIKHGYPLNMVEHEFFQIFMKNLQPSVKLWPQDALKDAILRVYKEEKKKLYKYLDTLSCHFSLIIQFWTCHRKKNVYCCFALRFLEDGLILKEKILALKKVDQYDDLTAETLFEIVTSLLREWNIDNKLCSITLTSPPVDKIVPKLKIWLGSKLSLCGYFFHMHCTTDFLNHLFQDGWNEVGEIISKRRNFDQTQEQHYFQGKYSVSPRWDSALLKLDAIEKNHISLKCDVVAVSELLKLLHVVRKILGGKYLTINEYFPSIYGIHFKLLELQKSEHPNICKMVLKMKMKFHKYFEECRTGLAIASILDPRQKFKYVTHAFKTCYGEEAHTYLAPIVKALYDIFDHYEKKLGKQALSSSVATHTGNRFTSYPDISNYDELNRSSREETCCDTKVASRKEIDQYLAKSCIDVNCEFDMLDWWHINSQESPILAKMALDILVIPMSMDSSFNIEDMTKITDPLFNGLHSDIAEALICGKNWLDMSTKKAPNKKDNHSSSYTLDGEPKDRDHTSMAMGEPSLSNCELDQDKPDSIDANMNLMLESGHQHGTTPHGTLITPRSSRSQEPVSQEPLTTPHGTLITPRSSRSQEPVSQEPLIQLIPYLSNRGLDQDKSDSIGTNVGLMLGNGHQHGMPPHSTPITPRSSSFQELVSQEPLAQPPPHLSNRQHDQDKPDSIDTDMDRLLGRGHQPGMLPHSTPITPHSLSFPLDFPQESYPLPHHLMPTPTNNIPPMNSPSDNSTQSLWNFY